MTSKYLNELFYHESDFSFDKIEPFFFTYQMCNSLSDTTAPAHTESHIKENINDFLPKCGDRAAKPPIENILLDTTAPLHTASHIKENIEHKNDMSQKGGDRAPFEPNRPDKLFWAIFTHVYGREEYDSIGHSYGNRALEEKTKIGSHIKKNTAAFKTTMNYKITNVMIQEIQSELMTMHSKTSHIEIIAMAFYYGIDIVLCFENNTYMTFSGSNSGNRNEGVDPLCIIYPRGNTYRLEMQPNSQLLDNMFKHHHYLRPLNAISNYKTEELYAIWHKLGMPPLTGKPKKQDIYHAIVENLSKV